MITLNKPIAVVCRMDKKGDIFPFKFRLKEAGSGARTCYISKVTDVRYGRHLGEETISYHCLTEIDNEDLECILRYVIEDSTWVLNQFHSTIGIAM